MRRAWIFTGALRHAGGDASKTWKYLDLFVCLFVVCLLIGLFADLFESFRRLDDNGND